MSDPTLLTTVTTDVAPSASKSNVLSNTNKSSTLLWLLVVVLIIAVIFLYMWRRGDRLALLATKREQMNFVTSEQCAAMIEESIFEYDKQQHQIVQHPNETTVKPSCIENEQEEEDEDDDLSLEEEEESTSSEEDEEPEVQNNDENEDDDEYDRVMSKDPAPPK